MAQKTPPEAQALELLRSVLPKTVTDAKLADKIITAVQKELESKQRVQAFDKYCKRAELLDLETKSLAQIQKQFEESFGKGNVNVVPLPQKESAVIEVTMGDETFEGVIKVGAKGSDEGEDPEFKPKFVPFPVSLHTDPELIWSLGRTENLTPDEGAIALQKVQDDFWASKAGQKLIKDRVERSFPEFVARVPAKLLTEVGLKRHYKEPETLKQLKVLKSK